MIRGTGCPTTPHAHTLYYDAFCGRFAVIHTRVHPYLHTPLQVDGLPLGRYCSYLYRTRPGPFCLFVLPVTRWLLVYPAGAVPTHLPPLPTIAFAHDWHYYTRTERGATPDVPPFGWTWFIIPSWISALPPATYRSTHLALPHATYHPTAISRPPPRRYPLPGSRITTCYTLCRAERNCVAFLPTYVADGLRRCCRAGG